MNRPPAIVVLGTYDSKAAEHEFLRERIAARGHAALAVHVGTRAPAPVPVAVDLFEEAIRTMRPPPSGRDEAIAAVLAAARRRIRELLAAGAIHGIVSAGGGTGTHIATAVMRSLPLGFPKVMVSTVASRDMRRTVGTKDVVMMHSVVDILGVNSILGRILDQAAAAVCAMAESCWRPAADRPRVALPFFGFITPAAEATAAALEARGYEVIPFHANGTGGMAMVELAAEGCFDGILELATHELADELTGGYCRGIGPERFAPIPGRPIPRLVVPGGLDCAVLEFTRDSVPEAYRGRKIFFYDFRSAVRLDPAETVEAAERLAAALNRDPGRAACLIPSRGWSEADREGGPLYDPQTAQLFVARLRARLDPAVAVREVDYHINDPGFAEEAAAAMHAMIAAQRRGA